MSYRPRRIPRHETRSLRGLDHRLTLWGDSSRPPVLLLHGWGDCSETWQFLVDCLPADWSFAALNWRGFGGSEWPAGGYWFPDYFADLEALLEMLSPDAPARLIAHSMGGNIASMYSGMRPGRIDWLVNLEGIGLRQMPADHAPDRYAEWLDELRHPARERRYTTLDPLVEFLLSRNPHMPRDHAEFIARAWCVPDGNGGFKLAFDPRHRNVNPTLFQRAEAEACWKRVTAPVLLVLAEDSEIRGRVNAEQVTNAYFESMFRDVRIEVVAQAGHMMHIERPETIAALCVDFAESLAARRLLSGSISAEASE